MNVNAAKAKVMNLKEQERRLLILQNLTEIELRTGHLGKGMLEPVTEFKYLGLLLCKRGSIEGKTRDKLHEINNNHVHS